jgi:hypothetical protein
MPRDANIVEPYRGIVALGILHGNAFNDDPSAYPSGAENNIIAAQIVCAAMVRFICARRRAVS